MGERNRCARRGHDSQDIRIRPFRTGSPWTCRRARPAGSSSPGSRQLAKANAAGRGRGQNDPKATLSVTSLNVCFVAGRYILGFPTGIAELAASIAKRFPRLCVERSKRIGSPTSSRLIPAGFLCLLGRPLVSPSRRHVEIDAIGQRRANELPLFTSLAATLYVGRAATLQKLTDRATKHLAQQP